MKGVALPLTISLLYCSDKFFVTARRSTDEMYMEHFKSLDTNGDGYVDMQEMRSSMLDMPQEYWATVERSMYERLMKLDTNNDGLLTWEEYVDALLGDTVDE
ncbi:hypothetical protein FOZ61_004684 [Perkinsus olseni]|uniref:EF-hand domain-containing protein n=1 Tax=Perkinsus olseni TaxID=32597 RepID=A0A7J6LJR6_PEROL|nr:hypothetical protein FOZ61_004684 [Perkinsus olseni]